MFEGGGGGVWAGRAARLVCLLVLLGGAAGAARAQCPTSDNIGWARGSTVRFFLDPNLSAEQRRQVRWGLAEWSRANSINNTRVRFVEDTTGQNFQYRILNGQLGPSTPAFANKTFRSDGTVVSATLTFNLSATFTGSNTRIVDPNQPGFDTIIIKLTLHETGHTMGLDHPQGASADACVQPDGATVMNFICNVNDRSNNMPLEVTACDRNTLNALPRYPPFNQTPNPIDQTGVFVRQHYLDFLNREPDAGGLSFWSSGIDACGADAACRDVKREDTSAAFFLSIEFQNTGYFVYRVYQAAFGDLPGRPVPITIQEFLPETQQVARGVIVGQGTWEQQLEANKVAFLQDLVTRGRFAARYPANVTPAQFVDALNANAGGALSQPERDALVAQLAQADNTAQARANVLRRVAEDADLVQREFNSAFVLMQYFGYLRRDPNDAPDTNYNGYFFWLNKLNQFGGDYRRAEMVKAFLVSIEYRRRFGQ
ncbi:MAG TPA: hypothetical protein VN228_12475 [Pyrinomonadaceae bacterium]|nr:hypothetical protein [Pyrinomonadaceae bacterium]